ncbi:AAA family ATPase [Candidatus Daviesbacteria bacterium]|nr:AAA family ATPase [Candidatus Daviesbacteria bacterium]
MSKQESKPDSFDNYWRDRLKNYPQTTEFQQLFEQLKNELKTPDRKLARSVVVSLIGIPGSGKSTFSTLLQEFIPALHLRSDIIGLERLPKESDYDYYKAYVIQEALTRHYLGQGYSVIMDDNNRTSYNREQVYQLAQSYGARNILFNLTLPFDLAVERTQKRDAEAGRGFRLKEQTAKDLQMFQNQIEEPTPEELTKFQVLYKVIGISEPISKIRFRLKADTDISILT